MQAALDSVPGGPVVIRERRSEDVAACVVVLREVHVVDRYPMVWMPDPVSWLVGSDRVGAWVAEVGGVVVGHVLLGRLAEGEVLPAVRSVVGGQGVVEVKRLFVAPAWRGWGVASALLGVAVGRAGGGPVVLEVVAGEPAMAVYERLGWREVARERVEWPVLPQRVVDLVWFVDPVSGAVL